MEIKKGKYKSAEVEKILEENSAQYQSKIYELKEKIRELTEDNSRLSAELQIYKNDESSIAEALKESQKKAKLNERKIDMQYLATLQSLKRFSAKWRDYFEYLLEKYPYYSAIKQADELRKELDEALNRQNASKSIQKIESSLDKKSLSVKKAFDPKDKIQDYIAATSDNGFNLDEVLNPGELKLEDLCKELGLLEENV